MAEYIEREALKETLHKRLLNGNILAWLCGIINEAPTADVAPVVHGRWVDGTCTHCGWEAPDYIGYYGYEDDDWSPTPYCPNCGAKMDGE